MVEADYSRFTPQQRSKELLGIFDLAHTRYPEDKSVIGQLLPKLISLLEYSEMTVMGKIHIVAQLDALQGIDSPNSYSIKSFGQVLDVIRQSETGPFLKDSAKSVELAAFADLKRETNLLQLSLDYGVVPVADAMEAILNNNVAADLWKKQFCRKYGEELSLPISL